jgi:uncharacterized secreted repeat protein (TIGR03808 family)
MTPNRRRFVIAGLGLGAAASAAHAAPKVAATMSASTLIANTGTDQTRALQAAIDHAAAQRVPLVLPAGLFHTGSLTLHPGSVITGSAALTTLQMTGTGALLSGANAASVRVSNLILDGGMRPLLGQALVAFEGCADLDIRDVTVTNAAGTGMAIKTSSGRVTGCTIMNVADAGLFALDSTLTISGNTVSTCGNNGILVWRSQPSEDGSQVTHNAVSKIRADGGGSGQNGNAINVYRAGSVQVANNRITDCAYSAVRGNAASNITMTANHCQRIGEVALYAEFGFTGALIANNIVDTAGCGVSVTNFNEGGRLAVVQGNLIRNCIRREHEPVDKRGEGIAVEADTLVSGNTIENAATCGILLGWKHHMRDVSATGNLIRGCPIGVLISSDSGAGSALITANLISGTKDGAIRGHDHGRAHGPDLAKGPPTSGRVTVVGNTVGG